MFVASTDAAGPTSARMMVLGTVVVVIVVLLVVMAGHRPGAAFVCSSVPVVAVHYVVNGPLLCRANGYNTDVF